MASDECSGFASLTLPHLPGVSDIVLQFFLARSDAYCNRLVISCANNAHTKLMSCHARFSTSNTVEPCFTLWLT